MAISLSYSFSANTTIQSAQVNSNFSTLATRAFDKTGDTMTGDLLFTDASFDIGKSAATRPRDLFLSRNATIGGTLSVTGTTAATGVVTFTASPVFSAQLSAPDGTNAAPSYAFTNDLDCGLYRVGANSVALSTNSVAALLIDSTQFIDSATQARCIAYHNTTQSLTDSTLTLLSFNSEDVDTAAMHDNVTNNTRITIPTGGDGYYIISGKVVFATNTVGERLVYLYKNGALVKVGMRMAAGASGDVFMSVPWQLPLVAGDYLELVGYQTSGGNLNVGSATRTISTELCVCKLW